MSGTLLKTNQISQKENKSFHQKTEADKAVAITKTKQENQSINQSVVLMLVDDQN